MKNLGTIEIGGSLDITTNKHVEDLIAEALEGIEIPEDTNTTYTLTQDGLIVQLVDDSGQVVSEIEIPEFEDKDPYQEVKSIATTSPENLFDILRGRYDEFILRSEFDEETNRITIRLHLEVGGSWIVFTIADNVSNEWDYYNADGSVRGSIDLVRVDKYTDGAVVMIGENTENRVIPPSYGGGRGVFLAGAAVQPTADSSLSNHSDGVALYDRLGEFYFVFPDVNEETVSDHEVITATLEDHLQGLYESIYGV